MRITVRTIKGGPPKKVPPPSGLTREEARRGSPLNSFHRRRLAADEVDDTRAYIINGRNAARRREVTVVDRCGPVRLERSIIGSCSVSSVLNVINGVRLTGSGNAQRGVYVKKGRQFGPVTGVEGVSFLLAEAEAANIGMRSVW